MFIDTSLGDFGLADEHPDFSSAGAAIEFGFYRSVCVVNSATGQTEGGIDNWAIRVNPDTSTLSRPGPFTDQEFLDSDWTLIMRATGRGGSGTGRQVAAGGNPGEHRTVVTRHNGAGTFDRTCVYGLNLKDGTLYDPSIEGAIASIDYDESSQVRFDDDESSQIRF